MTNRQGMLASGTAILLVIVGTFLFFLLSGCVSTVRFERKTPVGECSTTVTGTMPSFITPSAVAECRAEVK